MAVFRMDIVEALKSGEVTFSEWTKSLQSRSNLSRARLEQVVGKRRELVKTERKIAQMNRKIDKLIHQ